MNELHELRDRMRHFTDERGWAQFHDPKSLLLALVGEVGELAELLQWLPVDEAHIRLQSEPLSTRVAEEVSDVFLYLVRLADVLNIDLAQAAAHKLEAAAERFPVQTMFGVAPEHL